MSFNNGWEYNGFRQCNLVNYKLFGFIATKYIDGNFHFCGLFIDGLKFGYLELYNQDGEVDYFWNGFYLNNEKI